MKSYEELIGKHEGENAFILGAGPSLWFNMHNPLFTYLPSYGITIAVNSAVLADPGFNYWISNDALCRRWSWWKLVKKNKGKKIVRDSWLKHKDDIKDFYIFKPRPTSEDVINPDDKGLAYCSSVPSAIDLALQMGCKNIFVLGLDHMGWKGKHHFWEYMKKKPTAVYPAQGSFSQQKKVFPINEKAFSALKKFADHKKAKIYNISYMIAEKKLKWMTKVDNFEIIYLNQIEKILGKV